MTDPSGPRQDHPNALLPGTRLDEFELLGVLGIGGFGIVYRAFDHALEREVAIKEYLPASLAGRTAKLQVSIHSQADADSFALGLRSFVNEARLLARFDHPSLLKVLRFWEAHGTAYMAMPVLQGRTLKAIRQSQGQAPDEAWLRGVLMPLLDAIERLHDQGVFHRDIAPDNIVIEPDGHPVLLDFGAARRVLVDRSQALTAILKPAYAPIEQYGEAGLVRQGPWTDLYALGATLHYLLLGRAPAPATARALHDEATALTTAALPDISADFLRGVNWMLQPRPADRPQSVAQRRAVLLGHVAAPGPAEATQRWERTDVLPGGSSAAEPTVLSQQAAVADGPVDIHAHDPDDLRANTQPGGGRDHNLRARPPRASMVLPLLVVMVVLAGGTAAALLWPSAAASVAASTAASGATSVVAPAATRFAAPVVAPVTAPALAVLVAGTAASRPPAAVEPAAIWVPVRNSTPLHEAVIQPIEPVAAPLLPAAAKPTSASKPPSIQRLKAEPVMTPMSQQPPPIWAAEAQAPLADDADGGSDNASGSSGPAGPGCGRRDGIRHHVCMERRCGLPEFTAHPTCWRWKQAARRE
ncbi:MAG: protein kinase [Rubrivivax sp.]|nr:protein kinase [Rubrivivax sp.]